MTAPHSPLSDVSLHSVGDMEIDDDAIEIDGGGVVPLEKDPEEVNLRVEPVEPIRPAVRHHECAGMPASAQEIEWSCFPNGFNPEAKDPMHDGATDGSMNEDEFWNQLAGLTNHARTGILLAAARDIATQDGVAAPAPVAADDAVAPAPVAAADAVAPAPVAAADAVAPAPVAADDAVASAPVDDGAAAPAAIPEEQEENQVKPDHYKCLTCETNGEHWVTYSTSGNNADGNALRWCRRCGDRKGQTKSVQHRSWIKATNAEFKIHTANVKPQAESDAEIHAAEGKESKKRKKGGEGEKKEKKRRKNCRS